MPAEPLGPVPLKTTNGTEWAKAFTKHLKTVYADAEMDTYQGTIDELDKFAKALPKVAKDGHYTEAFVEQQLLNYARLVACVAQRFKQYRADFQWADSFGGKPTTPVKFQHPAVEALSCVVLAGQALMKVASELPQDTPEGNKQAYKVYCTAAGLFDWAKTSTVMKNAQTALAEATPPTVCPLV
eukprot:TRINITY_DN374_c0_g1_i2.p1 TRINITY_DN374_c0_g1~~TRINITY_DN374_c0_g1_i2.p1  ORF type:complete len:212 (+),score=69.73 TRINITY_DN374_c0_g1_i2:86-637(+)